MRKDDERVNVEFLSIDCALMVFPTPCRDTEAGPVTWISFAVLLVVILIGRGRVVGKICTGSSTFRPESSLGRLGKLGKSIPRES